MNGERQRARGSVGDEPTEGAEVVYRAPRSEWLITLTAFAVVLVLTAIAFIVGLAWWYRSGFTAFCVLFVVALVELARRL